jgi:hypothetical protein
LSSRTRFWLAGCSAWPRLRTGSAARSVTLPVYQLARLFCIKELTLASIWEFM